MTKEMKKVRVIEALTESGLVKQAVRNALREQFQEKYFDGEDWVIANDGSILMPLVEDVSGTVIYGRVQISITAKDEFATKGKKAKKDDDLDLSDLI